MEHLALMHIIKSKAELATTKIKRLLELLGSYSTIIVPFNLYYIKGKDMILSDFLSGQKDDYSNPHEIIPISFNMQSILHDRCYNLRYLEKYLVQTQSQAKSIGIKLPEVHGVSKGLDSNVQPEKQVIKAVISKVKEVPQIKPRLGQGRVGLRCKSKLQISRPIAQTIENH